MNLRPFKLEDYLSHYEFKAPYLLCCSDAESWSIKDLLEMASPEERTRFENLKLSYTEAQGLPELREQIAHSLYPGLSGDQILCFAGAEDGIFSTLTALCQPEDHAIVLTPCYQSLLEIPKSKGCRLTCLELSSENSWRIDLEAVEKAIRPDTKWFLMNFPHNPTGQTISPTDLEALIKILDKHGIWLFSDEVYRLLGPKETVWAPPAACLYSRAISLGVMSKAYGLAGLRIGWIACQDRELLKRAEGIKYYTTICNSAPSELLSLIALRNQKALLARNNGIVASNLALLDRFFEEYAHLFSWVRPQGGCVGFVHYKGQVPMDRFCADLVEKAGVLLLPASVYDHESNHFRIGFGRSNMPEALTKLKEYLENSRT